MTYDTRDDKKILELLKRKRDHFIQYYNRCPQICQAHIDVLTKAINEKERISETNV